MKAYRITALINLRDDDNHHTWIDEVTKALNHTQGWLVHLEIEPRNDTGRYVPINRKHDETRSKLEEL